MSFDINVHLETSLGARIALVSKLGIPCIIDFAQACCFNDDKP